jgi:predicted 2-oxoglutarate/Fe(II)-dependent dioxygenase YbiX
MWDVKHAAKNLEIDKEMQELKNKYEKEREEHLNLKKVYDKVRAKWICNPQIFRFTRLK